MTVEVSRHGDAAGVRFERPLLLLVEGGDDEALAKVQIPLVSDPNAWQVHNMTGNSTGWGPALEVILDDDWFSVHGQAVGLIMDADLNSGGAEQACLAALQRAGLGHGGIAGEVKAAGSRRSGVFIMPGPGKAGALEDLLLEAAEPTRAAEAEAFLSKLEASGLGPFKQRNKSLLQAYLASQARVTKTIPVAVTRDEVFPSDADCFSPFRDFLKALAGES